MISRQELLVRFAVAALSNSALLEKVGVDKWEEEAWESALQMMSDMEGLQKEGLVPWE